MLKFIEEFYYGNLDPQARSTKQNKTVQKQMEILMLNEDYLTENLSGESKKKFYIVLDDFERRVVVNCMNEMRNSLIEDGKCTDALDEVLLKIIRSKQKKLKVIYKEV